MHTNMRRVAVAAGALALVLSLSGFRYSGFNDTAAKSATAKANRWLTARQQSNGGFELAGVPGFETADAVLAIAENAQTTATWDRSRARAAVEAVKQGPNSPLHALDDFADSAINAGQAAKLIVLVAKPLGITPIAFDPDHDGAKNLRAVVDAGHRPNGSYGAFNATLYAAIAKRLLGEVPADTVAYIRSAQEAGGGWNYAGDPTGAAAPADVDTTALAIQALVAARVSGTDAGLRKGLAFLALAHQPNGSWTSFGASDPNSTSLAALAITAAGFNPKRSCWRDVALPARAGTSYTSPITWLERDQQPDGRFTSPNDSFGVNTLATTQSMQALRRGWIPVTPLAPHSCR